MIRIAKVLLLLGALAPLPGCAAFSGAPYPVVEDVPNPAPVPGYRVRCNTFSIGLGEHATACEPVILPTGEVLRARG